MPQFPRRRNRKREFEDAVRKRILRESAPPVQPGFSPAHLAELVRILAQELKRRGITSYEIRTVGDSLVVRAMEGDRPIEERYSSGDLARLITDQDWKSAPDHLDNI
jgi:hypothetical protein